MISLTLFFVTCVQTQVLDEKLTPETTSYAIISSVVQENSYQICGEDWGSTSGYGGTGNKQNVSLSKAVFMATSYLFVFLFFNDIQLHGWTKLIK